MSLFLRELRALVDRLNGVAPEMRYGEAKQFFIARYGGDVLRVPRRDPDLTAAVREMIQSGMSERTARRLARGK